MSFHKIKSYAKINLILNITGKDSLLHKIESIIMFTALHDEIFIKAIKSDNHNISFFGKFSSGINMNNIGFDKYATHCFDRDNFPYLEKFKDHEVDIDLIEYMLSLIHI